MPINPQNLGQNFVNKSVGVIKDTAINAAINGIAVNAGQPYRAVGYGQTPFVPLDQKLEHFNRYIVSVAQSMAGLGTSRGVPGAGTVQNIVDRIDLPLSSRLLMFQAVDAINPAVRNPVLVLPVNPDSFKVDYKKRSDLVYTLGGFVVTHWHDDAISISASGYIPSFQGKSKVLSDSYQCFLQLLNMYAECGQITQQAVTYEQSLTTTTQKTQADAGVGVISADPNQTVSANILPKRELALIKQSLSNSTVKLRYQNDEYEGIFLSFSIEESYDMPNTLQYSFTFKAMSRRDVAFGSLTSNETAIDRMFGEGSTASDLKGVAKSLDFRL